MIEPRWVGVWLLRRLPLGVANLLAWALAWFWWVVLPIRRNEAAENLRAALPEVPVRATLVRMMHDIVLGYVELFQYQRLTITVDADRDVRGAIVMIGHGGSWDVGLCAWAHVFPVACYLRPPKDAFVAKLIADLRDEHGVGRLETGATMADGYACLDKGSNLLFVQDQRHNKGPPIPFFGRQARTSLGAAVASIKTGRPVYGAWHFREGTGRHRIVLRRLEVSGTAEERTKQMNEFYAEQIRACPHGWLWLHRRWL